jgi:leucyl aminopeptidase
MTHITFSQKKLKAEPKKYVRLVVTEEKQNWHRLVETKEGTLEYRIGSGKRDKMNPRTFITFCRSVIFAAKAHQIEALAVSYDDFLFPDVQEKYGEAWIASTLAENFMLAAYEFTKYKTAQPKDGKLKEVLVCGVRGASAQKAFARGKIVGEHANIARDIANTTAKDMAPSDLARAAQSLSKGTKVSVKVLGEKELTKLKANLLLAVGQGTKQETKLIIIEYWGAGRPSTTKKDKNTPIVLIGKGITYDTGGLNVKPSGHMHDMHMDMSGGSSVIAAILCAAKLGLKKNIVALVPTAENAISDEAMRPGDIITSLSGKTVEVLHTHAEGRMVLADALTYAQRYNPKAVLDVATLTGAALVALGQHASAIMTKDRALEATLRDLGEQSGDYVWPLPLWDEYQQYLKSTRADISNIATNFSRFGGTIEGAVFLANFAPKCPWVHIDIAPRMDSIPSDKLAKGSTGEPVRLLIAFAEHY